MGRGRKKKVQVAPIEDEPPAIPAQQIALDLSSSAARKVDVIRVPDPPTPSAVPVTRRSLRNQIRLSTQPTALPNYEDDDDEEEEEEEEEEGEEDQEVFEEPEPIKPTPRKKRFLKETTVKKRDAKSMKISAAQSLNRLINKRVVKPPERMIETLPGRNITIEAVLNGQPKRRGRKKKNADSSMSMESQVATTYATSIRPDPASLVAIKMEEAEEQERQGHSDPDPNYTPPVGPKKRGRKRKSEAIPPPPPLLYKSIKREIMDQQTTPTATTVVSSSGVGDSTASPPKVAKQKRGRQSAATESITPRFPFCTICLSKSPPTDYIISYMSCPNEYQKMKRLFTYIYKDLKFPFLPFDLERENVFDYCDLPLCDSCIVIYKEIYEFYAQIETARDQLKTKVEEMVQKMQLSESNPVMTGQLKAIKNSPESLMNKYCNFRRRFVMYRAGESRAELDGSCLIPATIARIRVINPTPKRTSSTQTQLTSAHFTPPPSQESSNTATASTSSTPTAPTSTVTNGVIIEKSATTNAGTNETTPTVVDLQNKTPENTSPSAAATVSPSTNGTSLAEPKIAKPSEKTSSPIKSISSNVSQTSAITKPSQQSIQNSNSSLPSSSSSSQSSGPAKSAVTVQFPRPKPGHSFKVIPILPVQKTGGPSKSSNFVTIASPGRSSIFSKMPMTIPGAAASTKVSSTSAISPETSQEATVPIDIVKQEPMEAAPEVAEDSDVFFGNSITDPSQNKEATTSADKTEPVVNTSSPSKEDQSDTNVFRKHKKLRILSIPPEYEEPISSTSSDVTDTLAAKEKSKAESSKTQSENAEEPCAGTSSSKSLKAAESNADKSSSEPVKAVESTAEKLPSESVKAVELTAEKASSESVKAAESNAEKSTSKSENSGESTAGKASSDTEATDEDKNSNPAQEG